MHELIRQNAGEFVFADAIPFVQKHKHFFDIKIATHGNWELQCEKIQHSGLPAGIEPLISLHNKADVLRPFIDRYERIVFIDDKLKNLKVVKQALPPVITYWMRRSEDSPYGKETPDVRWADKTIANLNIDIA